MLLGLGDPEARRWSSPSWSPSLPGDSAETRKPVDRRDIHEETAPDTDIRKQLIEKGFIMPQDPVD